MTVDLPIDHHPIFGFLTYCFYDWQRKKNLCSDLYIQTDSGFSIVSLGLTLNRCHVIVEKYFDHFSENFYRKNARTISNNKLKLTLQNSVYDILLQCDFEVGKVEVLSF